MAFKVGRSKEEPAKPRARRVPLNYYRSGGPKSDRSPFTRRSTKKSRLRKYIIRTLDAVFIIIILGGLIYTLIVKPTPEVKVNDTTYHSTAEYQAAAAKLFTGFKSRNKITLNESAITAALQKQFPEIANASLELPLFSETPIVHLDIAEPSFFLRSNGQDYIIDSQGIATGVIQDQPQIKNLTTLTDQSGFKTFLGRRVLSAESVGFIKTVLTQSAHAHVSVKSLVLPQQDQELDLYTTDHSYYVKFYLGGDALLQTGQFLAARHNFDQTGKQPTQYLDVRVPGKIFYK